MTHLSRKHDPLSVGENYEDVLRAETLSIVCRVREVVDARLSQCAREIDLSRTACAVLESADC